jgi:hypothetical protein
MIYRKLSSSGDYTFGKGAGNFLSNDPATVAQAIQTALSLVQGEWFLDINAGVPYNTKVLGTGTKGTYDAAIQAAILGVQGVLDISSYSSSIDPKTRKASVVCAVDTIYGTASFSVTQKPFNYSPGYLDTTFVLDSSTLI